MTHDKPKVRRFLRMPEIEERTGVCRSTIYRMMAKGEFPKPKNINGFCRGWPQDVFDDWFDKVSKGETWSETEPERTDLDAVD